MTWLLRIFAKEAIGPIAANINLEATEESRAPASGGQAFVPFRRRTAFQRPFFFTPGILPFALRAGFAVRAAPAAQWLLFFLGRTKRK
jgi:hypothetical protein